MYSEATQTWRHVSAPLLEPDRDGTSDKKSGIGGRDIFFIYWCLESAEFSHPGALFQPSLVSAYLQLNRKY